MPYAIYTLEASLGEITYVGATINPTRRLQDHLTGLAGGAKVRGWIKDLRPAQPRMRVVCVVEGREEAARVETGVIELMKRRGHQLLNVHEVGGGGALAYEASKVTDVKLLLKAFSKREVREQKAYVARCNREGARMREIGK